MCGNGIRCFAAYVVEHGLLHADQATVRVQTDVGVVEVQVMRSEAGAVDLVTVDMGEPILDPAAIPTTLTGSGDQPVADVVLETELGDYSVTCVSMGNPHCVLFVDDVEMAPVHELGPLIETHAAFPRKTNVEFAQVVDDGFIRLRVWERGVGETLACGTGACATVVAASLTGRASRAVTVELLGGELSIDWRDDGHVLMSGPAEEVFSGVLTIEEDEE
jgi:diaminopimelate epimerase